MRKKRVAVTVENPVTDEVENLKVWMYVYPTDEWRGVDASEDDEFDPNVELEVFQVDAQRDGEWVDISAEWEFSPDLPELEEVARDAYIDRERERYAERIMG